MASQFIKSAVEASDWPEVDLPEVAFVGHSNSGKSSLINALARQKKLARVSQTPGKTDVLNFYNMDKKYVLVDTPGYGYAARQRVVQSAWTPMIETYLKHRLSLRLVMLILDIKREWTEDEANLVYWLNSFDKKAVLILNKADKLSQKELAKKQQYFSKIPGVEKVVIVSATKGTGLDEFNRTIFENLQ